MPIPKRVMQETPTSCFRACIASLLGLHWEDVPSCFDGDNWKWDDAQRWLANNHDLQMIEIVLVDSPRLYPVFKEVYCILTGKSPRACATERHAIVAAFSGMDGFRIIHDPHISDNGIEGEPTMITFLVPTKGR